MTRRMVRREAPAKINAFLRILGAREDGYHDLESLVVPVGLADVVTVRSADRLSVDVQGAPKLAGEVPVGGLNLALIAALTLADVSGTQRGARVEIDKRIPVAAGLGGGSADAAATIVALDELWGLGLGPEELADVGARIGSDVPALLAGRPVLVAGRGERLEPVPVAPLWWVIVPFDFGVRSPDAFRWWDEDAGPTGPDPAPLLAAAAAGDVDSLGPLLFNDLEGPVFARHPAIGDARAALLDRGARGAVMSGSGSAVVALAGDRSNAEDLAASIDGALAVPGPASQGASAGR